MLLPLTLSPEGTKGQVIRLTADDPLRKKLMDSGLTTGTVVTLLQVKDDEYTVQLKKRTLNLALNEAAAVWVQAN